SNGTIFQAASYRPMFEDRRARMVGDILTIAIAEKTSATKSSGDSASKTGGVAFAAPKIFGIPSSTTAQAGVNVTSSNKFEEKGAASTGNTFTGTITATVTDVLPNGYLVVSGEKQVALDKGVEYIRFSGVVNPDSVTAANVVSSTQVADARVEYRTNTRLDTAAIMSQLTKFFFSIMPL
ncbi:MAG: flagellar basal body L-ring protein FlgH, partial [Herminiimonas sp.]|nr:flagellar basal body L-ring protein FlgH [Herminiimonas sp.]